MRISSGLPLLSLIGFLPTVRNQGFMEGLLRVVPERDHPNVPDNARYLKEPSSARASLDNLDLSCPSRERFIGIDGDGGLDEMTIACLLESEPALKVDMMTSVAGNVGCRQVFRNTRALNQWANLTQIPVYPCYEEANAHDNAFGNNGLGDVQIPDSDAPILKTPSTQALTERLERIPKESAILFASGPLTNFARILEKRPELEGAVKQLYVMGGSLQDMRTPNGVRRGNITPHAEFNFYSDPEAAKVVLDRLGEKVTLFPMDCTHQHVLTVERERKFLGLPMPLDIKESMIKMLKAPEELEMKNFGSPPVIHDANLAIYFRYPELYTIESASVCVTTEGERKGRTDHCEGGATVNVCTGITDPDRAFEAMASSLVHFFGDQSGHQDRA